MSEVSDMYDTDGMVIPELKQTEHNVVKIDKGMVTEIEIMGKKFEIVNPDYIRNLQKSLQDVNIKLRIATQNINNLNVNFKKLSNQLNDIRLQLTNKIDRA